MSDAPDVPTHLFAYFANDFTLTRSALRDDRDRLARACPSVRSGWGLGFVQEGTALVRRRPDGEARPFDFAALASDTPSRLVIGAVMQAPEERRIPTNAIPPFRYRGWLMAGAPFGGRSLSQEVRARLSAATPDHVRRSVEGSGDDELVVKGVLSELSGQGLLRAPDVGPEGLARALRAAQARFVAAVEGAEVSDAGWECIAGNGRVLAAMSCARPLYWRSWSGVTEDVPEGARERERELSRFHFRGVLITTVPGGGEGGWARLAEGHVLSIDSAGWTARVSTAD